MGKIMARGINPHHRHSRESGNQVTHHLSLDKVLDLKTIFVNPVILSKKFCFKPFIRLLLRQAQRDKGAEGQRSTSYELQQQRGKTTLCLCAFAPMNLSSYV
jgi:hypothetical protein